MVSILRDFQDKDSKEKSRWRKERGMTLDIVRLIMIILLLITMFVNQVMENIYAEVSCGVLALFLLILHHERREP